MKTCAIGCPSMFDFDCVCMSSRRPGWLNKGSNWPQTQRTKLGAQPAQARHINLKPKSLPRTRLGNEFPKFLGRDFGHRLLSGAGRVSAASRHLHPADEGDVKGPRACA
jgi:hypothetical protein